MFKNHRVSVFASGAVAAGLMAGLVLLLLFNGPAAQTAPAPEGDKLLKEKLEEVKNRLPKILTNLILREQLGYPAEAKLVRRIGPEEAVVRILIAHDDNGGRNFRADWMVTVHLHYHDGFWSATRYEPAGKDAYLDRAALFLMQAVDECNEK